LKKNERPKRRQKTKKKKKKKKKKRKKKRPNQSTMGESSTDRDTVWRKQSEGVKSGEVHGKKTNTKTEKRGAKNTPDSSANQPSGKSKQGEKRRKNSNRNAPQRQKHAPVNPSGETPHPKKPALDTLTPDGQQVGAKKSRDNKERQGGRKRKTGHAGESDVRGPGPLPWYSHRNPLRLRGNRFRDAKGREKNRATKPKRTSKS